MLDSKGAELQIELEEGIQRAQQSFERKLATELAEKEATMQRQIANAANAADASEERSLKRAQQLEAELQALRESHERQRIAQEERAEDARRKLARLHKEKWDDLLGVDGGGAASVALVGEMEQESSSVVERMAALEGDEKKKLRARLDARQKERAAGLVEMLDLHADV